MILIVIFVPIVVLLAVFTLLSPRDSKFFVSKQKIFRSDGSHRKYYVSDNLAPVDSNSKLVIALHGFGDSPKRFAYYTAIHNVVDERDIVVYPSALRNHNFLNSPGWNSGFCCGSGWVKNIDDSKFLAELTRHLASKYKIKADNTFLAGFSNGAFMAQKLIIDHPDLYRALAVSSGTIGTKNHTLKPVKPTPILLMHGAKDARVNFDGSNGEKSGFSWISFNETLQAWEKVNRYKAPTKSKVYNQNGHKWNDWRILNFWHKKPEASIRAINFFDSF